MFQQPNESPLTGTTRSNPDQADAPADQSGQLQARLTELDNAHHRALQHLREVAGDAQAAAAVPPTPDADLPTLPSLTPGQKRFYASEQCEIARQALQALVDDPRYNTDSVYYSDNQRDFVDRHLHFLSTHPTTNLAGYLSNLKLMTNTRLRH